MILSPSFAFPMADLNLLSKSESWLPWLLRFKSNDVLEPSNRVSSAMRAPVVDNDEPRCGVPRNIMPHVSSSIAEDCGDTQRACSGRVRSTPWGVMRVTYLFYDDTAKAVPDEYDGKAPRANTTFCQLLEKALANLMCRFFGSVHEPVGIVTKAQNPCGWEGAWKKISEEVWLRVVFTNGFALPGVFRVRTKTMDGDDPTRNYK
jgi:hypothetical protein